MLDTQELPVQCAWAVLSYAVGHCYYVTEKNGVQSTAQNKLVLCESALTLTKNKCSFLK